MLQYRRVPVQERADVRPPHPRHRALLQELGLHQVPPHQDHQRGAGEGDHDDDDDDDDDDDGDDDDDDGRLPTGRTSL